jgi:hypothetical protein
MIKSHKKGDFIIIGVVWLVLSTTYLGGLDLLPILLLLLILFPSIFLNSVYQDSKDKVLYQITNAPLPKLAFFHNLILLTIFIFLHIITITLLYNFVNVLEIKFFLLKEYPLANYLFLSIKLSTLRAFIICLNILTISNYIGFFLIKQNNFLIRKLMLASLLTCCFFAISLVSWLLVQNIWFGIPLFICSIYLLIKSTKVYKRWLK